MSITLTPAEIEGITGYRRAAEQVEELRRQGFFRARRDRLGRVVVERAHYDAVCGNRSQPEAKPKLHTPTLRI